VLVVDDQESYSTGLADAVERGLKAQGVTVARASVSQKTTDFSSLIGRIGTSTKVVFLPFQLASEAQLFAQQLHAQGKPAIVFGSDGTYDSSMFTASGSYVSFFAPDVATVPDAEATAKQFEKRYHGPPTAFGVPNYVAAQIWAAAIHQACVNGAVTRATVRALLPTTSLSTSLLGTGISFTATGEVKGARFHVFKIVDGKYVTVQ
jgi:branched-chain amino acid transport system substrate-binding protein